MTQAGQRVTVYSGPDGFPSFVPTETPVFSLSIWSIQRKGDGRMFKVRHGPNDHFGDTVTKLVRRIIHAPDSLRDLVIHDQGVIDQWQKVSTLSAPFSTQESVASAKPTTPQIPPRVRETPAVIPPSRKREELLQPLISAREAAMLRGLNGRY